MIAENLSVVRENIRKACERAGRDLNEVTLIAVSKTKPVEMLEEAYTQGCRDFGENKVQELCQKYEVLPKDIRWHMIGHLQRNKVKDVVGKAYMIHSVDSMRLAEEISKEAVKKNTTVKILLEVNVAQEETKFGMTLEETTENLLKIAKLPGIEVHGFMTIAPFVENPEENRQFFQQLRQLFIDITNKKVDNIIVDHLSMGMTNDYEVAIEEGATYVRVGTGIFGERNYTTNQ